MSVWRACHNLLPTKANLFKRRVTDSLLCPICNLEDESVEHVVWSCLATSDVRSSVPKLQKSTCDSRNFAQLFEEMIGRLKQQDLELFAVSSKANLDAAQ